MTEAEWLASNSPVAMLHHLNADGNARKTLLYAAALLDSHPDLLTHELKVWRQAVEEVLTGRKPARALDYVQTSAEYEVTHLMDHGSPGTREHYAAIADVVFCIWTSAPTEYEETTAESAPVRRANTDLFRDIFGNPFRPASFSPAWRTDTALALAHQIYESHDFGAMPILADALQDAGCDSSDILDHCRGSGPHVRGCWVVDLVLGRQ
jgi:hypothetical protein